MSAAKKTTKKKTKKPPKVTAKWIEQQYWEDLLVHGKRPTSVYSFCKKLRIEEKEFYQVASSFQGIEEHTWTRLVTETQTVLEADDDYQSYEPQGKILAFFYTFFEHALSQRSRFLAAFPRRERALLCPTLKGMKSAFDTSAQGLMADLVAERSSMIPAKITEESYRGGWPVLLFLIEFWLNDTSDGFQDTDSLIEKVVRFGHEVTHFSALDAAFDLGKFIFGRNLS